METKSEMLKVINNTEFYRYYPTTANAFEVSIDASNKYGKGIYFLDNPYYYKDKFKDGMVLKIKPNLKNPKFYTKGNSVIPNLEYSNDVISALKENIKSRNEFTNKLIKDGYDSLIAIEPRGIYLVMFYNDPDNYEIVYDKKNVMAVGGEVKPLDFVSDSITNSIEDLIEKGDYSDLSLVEALFFHETFKTVEYGKGAFVSKDGVKGIMVKKLIERGYIDKSWLVYRLRIDFDDNFEVDYDDYSPTEKGYKFLNAIANRHRTRLGLKEGIDLFPEMASVKEYDERVQKNREKLNKIIETINRSDSNKQVEFNIGGEIEEYKKQGVLQLEIYPTSPEHSKEYGIEAVSPLYIKNIFIDKDHRLKSIGSKVIEHIEEYAKQNGHDVIFGYISEKAILTQDNRTGYFAELTDVDLIKQWLNRKGYVVTKENNDFYKKLI
jgi:GNAT superfamily N-acetyltransferase